MRFFDVEGLDWAPRAGRRVGRGGGFAGRVALAGGPRPGPLFGAGLPAAPASARAVEPRAVGWGWGRGASPPIAGDAAAVTSGMRQPRLSADTSAGSASSQ